MSNYNFPPRKKPTVLYLVFIAIVSLVTMAILLAGGESKGNDSENHHFKKDIIQ